eukprot:75910-Rhodomonas_salina.1
MGAEGGRNGYADTGNLGLQRQVVPGFPYPRGGNSHQSETRRLPDARPRTNPQISTLRVTSTVHVPITVATAQASHLQAHWTRGRDLQRSMRCLQRALGLVAVVIVAFPHFGFSTRGSRGKSKSRQCGTLDSKSALTKVNSLCVLSRVGGDAGFRFPSRCARDTVRSVLTQQELQIARTPPLLHGARGYDSYGL